MTTLATLAQCQDAFRQPTQQIITSKLGRTLCQRYRSADTMVTTEERGRGVGVDVESASSQVSACTMNAADVALLEERISVYAAMMDALPQYGFSPSMPLLLAASPGRDRLFAGHTDLQGLGGFTLDCATREELLCAAQATNDGMVHLHNSDPDAFPSQSFPIAQLASVARDAELLMGTRVFDSTSWKGYAQAAIAYMLCDRFEAAPAVRAALGVDLNSSEPVPVGVRFFVSSPGLLKLSHSGGISSSAALTGALSLSLCALFPQSAPVAARPDLLAQVDFAEYLLGKTAGAADKMAQLYARKGSITVISSLPESLRRTVAFPAHLLRLLVCSAPIPRLTLRALSRPFLAARGYDEQHQERVLAYAEEVMASFGSVAYVQAVALLIERLDDKEQCARVGLTQREAELLRKALLTHPPLAYTPDAAEAASATMTPAAAAAAAAAVPSFAASVVAALPAPTPCHYKLGLLRELCHGGSLEQLSPELRGWERRHKRYLLLFRALKLLPQQYLAATSPNAQTATLLHLRKAALYGLAEVERGSEYLMCMDEIQRIQTAHTSHNAATVASTAAPADAGDGTAAEASSAQRLQQLVQRILHLCSLCHDGDRAVVDYRRPRAPAAVPSVESLLAQAEVSPNARGLRLPECSARYFEATPWASDVRNDCSDRNIDRWIKSIQDAEVHAVANGSPAINAASTSTPPPLPQELSNLPGGFERGLVDVDELADEVARKFSSPSSSTLSADPSNSLAAPPVLLGAAVRISAAGLGGRVCVHARPEVSDELERFLVERGWEVRCPVPSAPTQAISIC